MRSDQRGTGEARLRQRGHQRAPALDRRPGARRRRAGRRDRPPARRRRVADRRPRRDQPTARHRSPHTADRPARPPASARHGATATIAATTTSTTAHRRRHRRDDRASGSQNCGRNSTRSPNRPRRSTPGSPACRWNWPTNSPNWAATSTNSTAAAPSRQHAGGATEVDTAELEARITERLDAAIDDVLDSTERLAAEQARYEIQFRADLAELAERLRRPEHLTTTLAGGRRRHRVSRVSALRAVRGWRRRRSIRLAGLVDLLLVEPEVAGRQRLVGLEERLRRPARGARSDRRSTCIGVVRVRVRCRCRARRCRRRRLAGLGRLVDRVADVALEPGEQRSEPLGHRRLPAPSGR